MSGLSKSRLMAFLQCPKRLWLEKHRPELAEVDAARQAVFDTGHAVGDLARRLYDPDGTGQLISGESGMQAALRDTRAALADPTATPLFEATLERDGLLVRVDVLDRTRRRLIEVKSTTSVKDEHATDCAIQAWVLAGSPAAADAVVLAHVNRDFTYPGDGDYAGLLTEADVTERIAPLQARVAGWLEAARAVVAGPEPDVPVGTRCRRPYECAFINHCWPRTDYPLTGLPNVGRTLDELVAAGYRDLRDLPPERVPGGDAPRVWRVARSGVAENDGSVAAALAALDWPRYYLDFETVGPAIPLWPGTRPYQAVPFQWSVHLETGPGQLSHAEFLDLGGGPPAAALTAALVTALGTRGPILTYTTYEKTCLQLLATLCPEHAPALEAIIARLVDLHPIVKRGYYHPAMQGSWSIKALVRALAPELDYSTLTGVRDGGGAVAGYLEAVAPGTTAARREELRSQLLEYCARDTLAMVRVVAELGA